jgi:hypothetical protein
MCTATGKPTSYPQHSKFRYSWKSLLQDLFRMIRGGGYGRWQFVSMGTRIRDVDHRQLKDRCTGYIETLRRQCRKDESNQQSVCTKLGANRMRCNCLFGGQYRLRKSVIKRSLQLSTGKVASGRHWNKSGQRPCSPVTTSDFKILRWEGVHKFCAI